MTPIMPLMPLSPVGLRGYGSTVLAQILYSAPFTYTLDKSGNTLLINKGSNGATNDLLLSSGRALELGATNDLPIPIHHTLGADTYNGDTFPAAGIVQTELGGGDWNFVYSGSATGDGSYLFILTTPVPVGNTTLVVLSFEATINSGIAPTFVSYISDASHPLPNGDHTVTAGLNQILCYARDGFGVDIRPVAGGVVAAADIDYRNIQVQEITSMANSFITYWSFDENRVIQLDMSTGEEV